MLRALKQHPLAALGVAISFLLVLLAIFAPWVAPQDPANIDLPDGMKLYVLHAEDGSVLGFTDGYASAYGAAVQNQFTPVSLH